MINKKSDEIRQQEGLLTGAWVEILYSSGEYNCVHTLNLVQKEQMIEGAVTKTQVSDKYCSIYEHGPLWIFEGTVKDNQVGLIAKYNGGQLTTFKLIITNQGMQGTWFDQKGAKGTVKFYKIQKLAV